MARQPLKHFNRLPPSLQKGEGFIYDITTHGIKNKDLYDRKQVWGEGCYMVRRECWREDEGGGRSGGGGDRQREGAKRERG